MQIELLERIVITLANGTIVLGIFIILLLNNKGVRKSRANMFLSILLASLTFSVFHLMHAGDVITHFAIRTYSLGDPTFMVIAPLLWFYVRELTGDTVRLNSRTLLHFIPFIAIVFCSLSFNSVLANTAITRLLDAYPRLSVTLFWVLMIIQFSTYQYFIRRKWFDYQKIISQEVSNTEDISISWVRFFMSVFLVVNVSFLVSLIAVIHFDVTSWVWKFVGMILSLSIFALGYKGILQREIFDSNIQALKVPAETTIRKDEPGDQASIEKLRMFMEEKKPYLDQELSLSSLSKELGMNRNQLSQLINEGVGENFYDFVNKYRVEEVKRLMSDPEKQKYNLLGIALEAGFKSKSTFNLIFKRFTGLTPSEYKKNIA